MYNKGYWYGKEVEGRLSDIETVFVRKKIPKNYKEYPHIYFTIEYIRSCIEGDWFDTIYNLIDTKQYITIEADKQTYNKIPIGIYNRVHIIYRIQDDNVRKLKNTDTISLDDDWYRVYQITKCHLMEIQPDNYKYDRDNE